VPQYTGVVHVHSTFSDGALSLEQVAALARAQQLDFVALGDHATHLTGDDIAKFSCMCADLSKDGLLLLPGLEFELEGRHVLAFGPEVLLRELDAPTVVKTPDQVRERGGLTVWAHPALTYAWNLREPLRLDYDGWEIWNSRVDGARPCLPLLAALRRAFGRGRGMIAIGGVDFHQGDHFPEPFVVVEGPSELTASALLEVLRLGHFETRGKCCKIDVRGQTTPLNSVLWPISAMKYVLTRMRGVLALARYKCLLALKRK
jgi:hypothetical protein